MSQSYHPKGQGFWILSFRMGTQVYSRAFRERHTTVYTSHFSGWWYKALPWTSQCFEKKHLHTLPETSDVRTRKNAGQPKRKANIVFQPSIFRSKGFRPKIPVTLNSPRTIQFFRKNFLWKLPYRSPRFLQSQMLFLYGMPFTYQNLGFVTNGAPNLLR